MKSILENLEQKARVSISDCKMFDHTPRRLFNEVATPENILLLIEMMRKMESALEFYANKSSWVCRGEGYK